MMCRRLRLITTSVFAGVVAWLGGAVALACLPAPPSWESNPWEATAANDEVPPSRAPVITGIAEAPEAAEGCGGDDLSPQADCSHSGSVRIFVEERALDDETAPAGMAYRVEVLRGDVPFPEHTPIYPAWDEDGVDVLFASVSRAELSAELRLIPVDAGGNDGPPSNTIRVGFDESGNCSTASSALPLWGPVAAVLWWLRRRRP